MKELIAILQQVVTKQFYKLNTGFFLVVFFLCFGIQQPATFLVSPLFLKGAAASPLFTGIILGIFFLYYLKCFNFLHKTVQAPENEYLFVASLLPWPAIFSSFAVIQGQLFLPAMAYTLLLSFHAVLIGKIWVLLTVVVYHLLLISYTGCYFYFQLKNTRSEDSNIFSYTFSFILPKIPALYPLYYLLRQEKVMLVLTKLFSGAVLYLFLVLYPSPEYGIRPAQIGFLIALIVQAMVVRQIQYFQETGLPLLRQLPITWWQRLLWLAVLFGLLLLPEAILLLRFIPVRSWLAVLELLCFGVSFLLFSYSLLYLPGITLEKYLRRLFFFFIGMLLLLLCYPPVYLISVLMLLLAWLILWQFYYRYEVSVNQT